VAAPAPGGGVKDDSAFGWGGARAEDSAELVERVVAKA
jgi:hypothetical protein